MNKKQKEGEMKLKIAVIPTTEEEFIQRRSILIDEAKHQLLDLLNKADWFVEKGNVWIDHGKV